MFDLNANFKHTAHIAQNIGNNITRNVILCIGNVFLSLPAQLFNPLSGPYDVFDTCIKYQYAASTHPRFMTKPYSIKDMQYVEILTVLYVKLSCG